VHKKNDKGKGSASTRERCLRFGAAAPLAPTPNLMPRFAGFAWSLEQFNSSTIYKGRSLTSYRSQQKPRRRTSRRGVKESILTMAENCEKSPPPNR
jgi:hypothetical protein